MKIGIDLDEVIAEFMKSFLYFYNCEYKKNIQFNELTSYNLWEVGIGENREEAINFVDEFYISDYFSGIRLASGAKESLLELAKRGDSLAIITSRPERFMKKTDRFAAENLSNLILEIFYSGDFHKSQGKSKADICIENRIRHMLEDNFEYAAECAGKGIKVLLFDKPWNQQENNMRLNGNIIRVKNWKEALEKI